MKHFAEELRVLYDHATYFVVPYCHVYPVQFLSGVSVLIHCFCLFGIDILYVQVTVQKRELRVPIEMEITLCPSFTNISQ